MRTSSPIGQGFPNTDNLGDVRRYARESTMERMMSKHRDDKDPFHIGMHDMMVCGQQFSETSTDFSIFYTNIWFLLTAFRVMISGWGLNIFTDLFHRFCTAKVKMICYGCCSLGYRLNPLMFGTVPDEKGEPECMYTSTWNIFLRAIKTFVTSFKACADSSYTTCKHIMTILEHSCIRSFIASAAFAGDLIKIPVRSFSSDNGSGFLKFVRSAWPDGSVLALICSAHLNGEFILFFNLFSC